MHDRTTPAPTAPDATREVHTRVEGIRGWTAHLADGSCTVEYAVAGINGLCDFIERIVGEVA